MIDINRPANKNFRYPGAHSFLADQKDIFFGRERDIEQLSKFITLNQISVLFSKSGLGKSSLLNAGIIPFFLQKDETKPVYIRFKAYNEQQNETPTYIARRNIVKDTFEETYLDTLINNEPSLWHDVKEQQITKGKNISIILIFDQFEELFDYPDYMIQEFKEHLAEILFTIVPQRYRNEINKLDIGALSSEQLEMIYSMPTIKVVFSIRSDRMHLLNILTDYIPTILKNCYELKSLEREQAEDAIINPAFNKESKFFSPKFSYTYGAIDKILQYLTKSGKRNIESFQLQVLCHALELKVKEQNIKEINEDNIGNLDEISQNYYFNQLSTITKESDRLSARRLIEEGLIFEIEQRRISLLEGIIERDYGIDQNLLQKLVQTRLVRSEPLHDGGYVYELSHDSLVAPILKAKESRKDEEEKKDLRRAAIEAREKEDLSRRKQQRARLIAIISTFLLLLSLGSLLWGYNQSKKAEALLNFGVESKTKQIQESIDNFQYDSAISSIRILEPIIKGNFKVQNQCFEIAFLQNEAGDLTSAKSIAKEFNLFKTNTITDLNGLQKIFLGQNPHLFIALNKKYYPNFVALQSYSMEFSETEITNLQYSIYLKSIGGSIIENASNWGIKGYFPVVKVDWYDAIEYANWLSERKGFEKVYKIEKKDIKNKNLWIVHSDQSKNGYRLPSISEWKLAAKNGDEHDMSRFAGSDTLSNVGWYLDVGNLKGVLEPHKVGMLRPNKIGLYDMSGNVWEWCEDDSDLACCGNSVGCKVTAGGAFNMSADFCKIDSKDCGYAFSTDRSNYNTIGFRLCRTIKK